MIKKINGILLAFFASVFILIGCGDPYSGMKLTVDSPAFQEDAIVLYLHDGSFDSEEYPLSSTLTTKVTGGDSSASRGVSIVQYSNSGAESSGDIVSIKSVETSGELSTYEITAQTTGKAKLVISSNEGGLRQEVDVIVYSPIQSVEFNQDTKAIEYLSSVNLYDYLVYNPTTTNQTEMDFYISSNDLEDGVTQTEYAKIENGVLYSLNAGASGEYPTDIYGQAYISVYGVSNYLGTDGEEIVTTTIDIPVLEIITLDDVMVYTTTGDDSVEIIKTNNKYQLVLANNKSGLFENQLTIKLDSSNGSTDKNYSYSTNHKGTAESIVQLDSLTSQSDRENTALGQTYSYQQYSVKQLSTGTEVVEIYIDRVGYEGIFTKVIYLEIVIKEFAETITAIDQAGADLIATGSALAVYSQYATGIVGSRLTAYASSTNSTFAYSIIIENNNDGKISVVNAQGVSVIGTQINSGTIVYFKHTYTATELEALASKSEDDQPRVYIVYSYNLAPTGADSSEYEQYTMQESFGLSLSIGLTEFEKDYEGDIKINATTGQIINGDTTLSSAPLVYITDTTINLQSLISSVTIVSIDGLSSSLDAFSNQYFDLLYISASSINGIYIEPKQQYGQVNVVLNISTYTGITEIISLQIFVPIVYSDQVSSSLASVEIYDYSSVRDYIYTDLTAGGDAVSYAYVGYDNDSNFVVSDSSSQLSNYRAYTSLTKLTVATSSKIGFDIYNFISIQDVIYSVNYGNHITVSDASLFYITTKEQTDSGTIIYLNIGTNTGVTSVTFTFTGYNDMAELITVTKTIELTIIIPTTNISVTPAVSTLYTQESVGAYNYDKSEVQMYVSSIPTTSVLNASNIYYTVVDTVLYAIDYVDFSGDSQYLEVVMSDFISVDINGLITVSQSNAETKLQPLVSAGYNAATILSDILSRDLVAEVVVTYIVENKPEITKSIKVNILKAEQVTNIITDTLSTGVYFDIRNQDNNVEINFTVLPLSAYNKNLRIVIEDYSKVEVVSGVTNGVITGGSIVLKPLSAGSTTIYIYPEDSYYINSYGGYSSNIYAPISVRIADGTEENPFELYSSEDIFKIGQDIKNGNNSYYYMQAQDIYMQGETFTGFDAFNGTINGLFSYTLAGITYTNQTTIYNLTLSTVIDTVQSGVNEVNIGMFSQLLEDANLINVQLSNATVNVELQSQFDNVTFNIGTFAGINSGVIFDSVVDVEMNILSEHDNVNVGGFVGYNKTDLIVSYDSQADTATDFISYTYNGVIGSLIGDSSSQTSAGDLSGAVINFTKTNQTSDMDNINIGGVAGLVTTFATYVDVVDGTQKYFGVDHNNQSVTIVSPEVLIYQIDTIASIQNMSIVSYITSMTNDDYAYASIGGIVGNLQSSVINSTNAFTNAYGYSNVGGLVGSSMFGVIKSSNVDFANAGQTGLDTIALSAYTNLGGLVGWMQNTNVMYSYARSYFNQTEINDNYQGNIALRQGDISNTAVGGLVGYVVEGQEYSEQLSIADNSDYFQIYIAKNNEFFYNPILTAEEDEDVAVNPNNLINFNYLSSVYNSYFDADINAQNANDAYVGGLVGFAESKTDNLQISNSYFAGMIEKSVNTLNDFNSLVFVDADISNISPEIDNQDLAGKYISYAYENGVLVEKIVTIDTEGTDAIYNTYGFNNLYVGNQGVDISAVTQGDELDESTYTIYSDSVAFEYQVVQNYLFELSNDVADLEYSYMYVNSYGAVNNQALELELTYDYTLTVFTVDQCTGANIDDVITYISDDSNVSSKQVLSELNNDIVYSSADLLDINTFEGFNIVAATLDASVDYYDSYNWLLASEINNAMPVLFALKGYGNVLYKLIPSQISTVLFGNPDTYSNNSYLVDNGNLILFYNEYVSGSNFNNNQYQFTLGDQQNTTLPYYVSQINLETVDLSIYGISASFDGRYSITSSNSNVVTVNNDTTITTTGVGVVTLTIASIVNQEVKTTLEVMVVNGVSDFAMYDTKNLYNSTTKVSSNTVNQVIDADYDYYLSTSNADVYSEEGVFENLNMHLYNGVYVANNDLGAAIYVNPTSTGSIKVNGTQLNSAQMYYYTSLSELIVNGVALGNVNFTITPFIISTQSNFGELVNANGIETYAILINELTNEYNFNIVSQAQSIVLNQDSAKVDVLTYVDVELKTVTSDFALSGGNYTVNESITMSVYDSENSSFLYSKNLSNANSLVAGSTDSNYLLLEILGDVQINAIDNSDFNIELVYSLRFSFDLDSYQYQTNDTTFNLNNIEYDIVFVPSSNDQISANFNFGISPREISKINAAYYPNGNTTTDGELNPQEVESSTIVPSRQGMMVIDILPTYTDAESVTISVDSQYSNYVIFTQYLVTMSGTGGTGYIDGYVSTSNVGLNGVLNLSNRSISNGTDSYIYNGTYYVGIYVLDSLPLNATLAFTITATKTVDGNSVELMTETKQLTTQTLPSISMSVDGDDKDIVAKGLSKDIEIEYDSTISFSDIVVTVSLSNPIYVSNVSLVRNADTNSVTLNVGANVPAGTTIVVTASVTKTINGVIEVITSQVSITVVEYIIASASVNGVINGSLDVLTGTTTALSVVLNAQYSIDNVNASIYKEYLQNQASGKSEFGSDYQNNWYYIAADGGRVKIDVGQTINSNYTMRQYSTGITSSQNNFGVFAERVSDTNALVFAMYYYYDYETGIPVMLENYSSNYQVKEIAVSFNLNIKDNSTYDNPTPITSAEEFMELGGLNIDGSTNGQAVELGHYILTADIEIDSYTPFDLQVSSLDGNGYVIRVNSINTSQYADSYNANVGIFNTISSGTVLKNFTVDVANLLTSNYNATSSTYKIDLQNISGFNFGVIAGTNYGSITNAQVVSTQVVSDVTSLSNANLFIKSTQQYINGSLVDANIGGLVGVNDGVITNSYVGLSNDENNMNTNNSYSSIVMYIGENNSACQTYAFNLVGGKSIAGFVHTNRGVITNNYNLGVSVINVADSTDGTATAGFVVTNSSNGQIFNSFVEGLETVNYRSTIAFIEAKGNVGGFVYTNSGEIRDAYSNIVINTNTGCAGGFVYYNDSGATITNAYSTSRSASNSLAIGAFTGLDAKSNFNNYGSIQSAYYLLFTTESKQVGEPAIAIEVSLSDDGIDGYNAFEDVNAFYGFNIENGTNSPSIWVIASGIGPRLVNLSSSTYSLRTLTSVVDDVEGGTTYNYEYSNDSVYGSATNPLLVNTYSELETFIVNNANSSTNIFGATSSVANVRLINNLTFTADSESGSDITLDKVTFVGNLEGNGLTISGVNLSNGDTAVTSFGLFKQIGLSLEEVENYGLKNGVYEDITASIKNLNITVNEITANNAVYVGSLAGIVYNSTIANVNISSTSSTAKGVSGTNIVGGVAGLVVIEQDIALQQYIVNINVDNLSVKASSTASTAISSTQYLGVDAYMYNSSTDRTTTQYSYYDDGVAASRLSYAGGVFGIIETNERSFSGEEIVATDENYVGAVSFISSTNGGIINAEKAGGLFGLVGKTTIVSNSTYLITSDSSNSQEIYAGIYGGAISAENYGVMIKVVAQHDEDTQSSIDLYPNVLSSTENQALFNNTASASALAIGAFAGYSQDAEYYNSYSKISVVAENVKIAGGVVGISKGTTAMKYVYATGNVYGSSVIGGLIGMVVYDSNNATPLNVSYTFAINKWSESTSVSTAYAKVQSNLSNVSQTVIRFPEVGNQQSKDTLYNTYMNATTNSTPTYVGSLLGYVSNTDMVNGGMLQTQDNTDYYVKDDGYKVTENDSYNTIISTTSNSSTIANVSGAGVVFDINIGSQMTIDDIVNYSGLAENGSMFIMYILDGGTEASVNWVMDGYYPRHIVGLETSVTSISSADEYNAEIVTSSSTKGGFYQLENDISVSNMTTLFEGTLIGGNHTITYTPTGNLESIALFETIKSAMIQNVIIEIILEKEEYKVTSSVAAFAENVINSVLSGIDFIVTFTNTEATDFAETNFKPQNGTSISTFGLIAANVTSSSLANINLVVDSKKVETINLHNNSTTVNMGYLAGVVTSSSLNNISVTSTGNDLSANYGSNVTSINLGAVVGYTSNSTMSYVNTSIDSSDSTAFIYPTGEIASTATVNVAGLVGYASALTMNAAYVQRSIEVGYAITCSTLNIAGAVAYATSSTLQHVNINEKTEQTDNAITVDSSANGNIISVEKVVATTLNVAGVLANGSGVTIANNNSQTNLSTAVGGTIQVADNTIATSLNVAGVVALMTSSGTITNSYNKAIINIANITSSNASVYVGGIAGKTTGADFKNIINYTDITVSAGKYYVGTIVGSSEGTGGKSIGSFINFGDIIVTNYTQNTSTQVIGGVAGTITGSSSLYITNGYTMARLLLLSNDVYLSITPTTYVNAIAYAKNVATTTFVDAYYVLEFMPYAELSSATVNVDSFMYNSEASSVNIGAISYVDLVKELNIRLTNGFNGAGSSATSSLYFVSGEKILLPTLADMIDPYVVYEELFTEVSGKLNPTVVTNVSDSIINQTTIDGFIILDNTNAVFEFNNLDTVNGGIFGSSRTDANTVIFAKGITNYGVISNINVDINGVTKSVFALNNGTITNVIVSGDATLSANDSFGSVAYINNGAIVQTGTVANYTFIGTSVTINNVSGFVLTNSGYIKDSYTLANFVSSNQSVDYSNTAQGIASNSNTKFAAFVITNNTNATIETSYASGALFKSSGISINTTNIFAGANSGSIFNSYTNVESYDYRTNKTTVSTLQTAVITSKASIAVTHLTTAQLFTGSTYYSVEEVVDDSTQTVTNYLGGSLYNLSAYGTAMFVRDNDFVYNYGYPYIKNSLIVNLVSNENYNIYQAGQLNNLDLIGESSKILTYNLQSHVNMLNVNATSSSLLGKFTNSTELNKSLHGNGYTVFNLTILSTANSGALFTGVSLSGLTVKDINFRSSSITTNQVNGSVLFEQIQSSITIQNVNFYNTSITANSVAVTNMGALVGKISATGVVVSNVTVVDGLQVTNTKSSSSSLSSSAESNKYTGGLIGYATELVTLNNVTVGSSGFDYTIYSTVSNVGGVIGSGSISSTSGLYVINVKVVGLNNVGGIAGVLGSSDKSTQITAASVVSVNVGGVEYVGGVAGNAINSSVTVTSYSGSAANVEITATGTSAGGVVGYMNSSSIIISTNLVPSVNANVNVGGVAGYMAASSIELKSDISQLTSKGVICVGGLVGKMEESSTISGGGYNVGNAVFESVVGNEGNKTNTYIGGIVGEINDSSKLTNITAGSSLKIYGASSIGGIAGSINNKTNLSACTIGTLEIYYLSATDMDGENGKNDGLTVGVSSTDGDSIKTYTTYITQHNFDEYFGLAATYGTNPSTLFDVHNSVEGEAYVMEYGGLELKNAPGYTGSTSYGYAATSNESAILGQAGFNLNVGIAVGNSQTAIGEVNASDIGCTVSGLPKIKNLYDIYTTYNIQLQYTSMGIFTADCRLVYSKSIGVRVFDVAYSSTYPVFISGSNTYLKYNESLGSAIGADKFAMIAHNQKDGLSDLCIESGQLLAVYSDIGKTIGTETSSVQQSSGAFALIKSGKYDTKVTALANYMYVGMTPVSINVGGFSTYDYISQIVGRTQITYSNKDTSGGYNSGFNNIKFVDAIGESKNLTDTNYTNVINVILGMFYSV